LDLSDVLKSSLGKRADSIFADQPTAAGESVNRDSLIATGIFVVILVLTVGAPVMVIAFGDPALTWSQRLSAATTTILHASIFINQFVSLIMLVLLFIFAGVLAVIWIFQAPPAPTSVERPQIVESKDLRDEEEFKVLKLEPNFYGMGVNLIELWKWIKSKLSR
jgi:predicted membrane protein